ncbi:ATP-binding protein [Lacticaseibacillus paracasei]|uniref:ATP-binding protein n=1 Tax=Lacticaseibacillus paracasei TaxID=1597 RepID=UPI000FEE3A2F|nr:ATP-binding protein [Lacticaseibacillus paracasei]RWZ62696.1 ATP-binding protein [Lacticaseibacillus paracasei]
MNVDSFYTQIDKENFYLGIISQVYRANSFVQVENLSVLSNRKIRDETLNPNTINYLVVIEDNQGLFIGEVYQAKVQDNDVVNQSINLGKLDRVFPELGINVIGLMHETESFKLPGFKTVGINDRVYVANSNLIERFQQSLQTTQYNQFGADNPQELLKNVAVLANSEGSYFSIQPNALFERHLLVIGSTNSGKSTSSLAILDSVILNGIKVLVIDPTGEYSDSFPEESFTRLTLGVDTFLPTGMVSIQQWELLFQANGNTQGAVLADAITSLRFQMKEGLDSKIYKKDGEVVQAVQADMQSLDDLDTSFNLLKLPEQINAESVELGNGRNQNMYVLNNFRANSNSWLVQKVRHQMDYSNFKDFFVTDSRTGASLLDQLDKFCESPNGSLYVDASRIGVSDGVGSMIVDLISNYLIERQTVFAKPFVLFVDEVHRYTQFIDTDSPAESGLINVAREGRKRGVFLFLTTQSPSDVPKILYSQIGTLLVHRLTSNDDLQSIKSHLDERSQKQIIGLNQGEALLISINLLRKIQLKFIPSSRVHHNETPLL